MGWPLDDPLGHVAAFAERMRPSPCGLQIYEIQASGKDFRIRSRSRSLYLDRFSVAAVSSIRIHSLAWLDVIKVVGGSDAG